MSDWKDDSTPVSFQEVLRAEYASLRPGKDFAAALPASGLWQRVHRLRQPLGALCLSGGGIRSATFALGVIQGLAERGVIDQFDYLSTVSGGGYLGGWLSAWIHRSPGGVSTVVRRLRPSTPPPSPGEPDPIAHLRAYSNYLTPRLGACGADTWTLAATVIRNILLNWLVLIPLLLGALMLPRLALAGMRAPLPSLPPSWTTALPWAAALFLTLCLWNTLRYLPGIGGIHHSTADFLAYMLAPLAAATLLFATDAALWPMPFPQLLASAVAPCLGAWTLYCAFHLLSHGFSPEPRWLALASLLGAMVMVGVGAALAGWMVHHQLSATPWPQYVTLAPPVLLLGFGLAGSLFTGLSSHLLGSEDREWIARAGAYLLLFGTGWAALCGVVLLAPAWVIHTPAWIKGAIAAAAVAAGGASSLLGFRSPANPEAPHGSPPSLSAWMLKILPGISLALLAVGLAMLTDRLLAASGSVAWDWRDHLGLVNHTSWPCSLAWTAGFLALGWVAARFVNINQFSLQGMYRDRLIRAYLGASNPASCANSFTGFSSNDDLPLHALAHPPPRPLPVLNLTLNLVSGERLAWQQRKAESFTASPFHCGNHTLGYRPTARYGGRDGITLGTAVAVSGAAASPNMGYHSSPLVGFLMTLVNLRLGAWFGNPGAAGARAWTHAGPRSALRSLARESLGLTTDRGPYVYLSDGGHFENLGLYEMVLRRVKHILVIDAGCDEQFTFEDLGNALAKIRIDLRIPIVFDDDALSHLRAHTRRCALARIRYSAVDEGGEDGELLYLKPMLRGTEPPDVVSYANTHPSFPHQSTTDQWFSEAQTESYRMLGLCTITDICQGWGGATLSELARHIRNQYLPKPTWAAGASPDRSGAPSPECGGCRNTAEAAKLDHHGASRAERMPRGPGRK